MKSTQDLYDVHLADFERQVLEASRDVPVLVDFWAEWCAPCIIIAPLLEKILLEFNGRVRLAKLEVDEGENMKLAGHYKVRGFPTIILFKNGEEIDRFSGARPLHFLREFLDRHLPARPESAS